MTDAFRSDNSILRFVTVDLEACQDEGIDIGERVRDLCAGILETLSAIGADVPVIRDHPRIDWTTDRTIADVVARYGSVGPFSLADHVIRMTVAGQHADVVHALRVMLAWLATRPTLGITVLPPFDGTGEYTATVSVSFGATADAIGVFHNAVAGRMVDRVDLREMTDRDDALRQMGFRRVSEWSTVDYPTATVVPI